MPGENFPVPMKIERFFDGCYHLSHNLSASDPESLTLSDLLSMADPECRDLWNNMKFSYTDMSGHPLLLREVAKLHGVQVEDVLEVIPIEGIFLAMHCLVRYLKWKHSVDSFHTVTTYPAYQSLQENLRMMDCEISDWDARYDSKGWHFDLSDLKSQLRDNTRLVVVNFPHNPTGACIDAAQWSELLALCKEREIFLFSDEMYRLSNLDETIPLASACSEYEESMSLSGLSKTFALPGIRMGWLCTKNAKLRQMLQKFKDYTSVCGSLPSEILAVIALRNKEKIVKRTVDICQTNLLVIDEFLKQYPELFEWRAPSACTVSLLRLKGWLLNLGEGGATGFSKILQQETGVALLPASDLNYKPDSFVRLGFGRANAAEALDKLKNFIQKRSITKE